MRRRSGARVRARSLRIVSPLDARIVNCGKRGIGIETSQHLAVGSLATFKVLCQSRELVLLGNVCWAKLIRNRSVNDDEVVPVYRAGIALTDGHSLELWDRVLSRLLSAAENGRKAPRRRKVVKWRAPFPASDLPR